MLIEDDTFSPEFLNRFDGVFLYRPLSREHARQIVELLLEEFKSHIKEEKNISVTYNEDLVSVLSNKAYNSTFGGRAIRRTLEKSIGNFVADTIISGKLKGDTILLTKDIIKEDDTIE